MANPQYGNVIQKNYPKLLERIQTKFGLYGELLKFPEEFHEHFLTCVWEIQDTTTLVGELLSHVSKGGEERFNCFCTALCASGQRCLVDEILMKPPSASYVDQPDAVPVDADGIAAAARLSTTESLVCLPGADKSLSPECYANLRDNWNVLLGKIVCDEEFLGHLRNVFTAVQIKQLEDKQTNMDQVQQMLNWVRAGNMATFNGVCDALVSTNQQHMENILRQPKVPCSVPVLRAEQDDHDKQFQLETGEADVPGELTTGLTSLRISDSRPTDSVEFTSSHSERDVVLAQTLDKPVGVITAMAVPCSVPVLRGEPDGHDEQFQLETGGEVCCDPITGAMQCEEAEAYIPTRLPKN